MLWLPLYQQVVIAPSEGQGGEEREEEEGEEWEDGVVEDQLVVESDDGEEERKEGEGESQELVYAELETLHLASHQFLKVVCVLRHMHT